jgi:hypothetical protein
VRGDLASAILRAAYAGLDAALASQGGVDGDAAGRRPAFARALATLRAREYGHYLFEGPTREGERARPGYVAPPPPSRYNDEVAPLLAALEAEQGAPGASSLPSVPPPIFDFAIWSLLKAVATELPPSQAVGGARSVFNAECGRTLARAVGGDLLERVTAAATKAATKAAAAAAAAAASAAAADAPVAPFASVAAALEAAMDRLADGGYFCSYQVTYGDQPGSWPADWPTSEPKINGDAGDEAARTLSRGEPLPLQLRVSRPADVGASVALRNEEWGFCARLVAGVFAAFLEAGGYGALVSASVGARSPAVVDAGDVYYAQDALMARPSSLRERLLLALGDPLVEVVVSFTPETEVQDWSVVVPAAARRAAAEAAAAGGRAVGAVAS